MIKSVAIAMSLVLVALTIDAAEPYELLAPGRKILFLGDSITRAEHYACCLEAQLRTANPDAVPVLINLGLPSETCSGLSGRAARVSYESFPATNRVSQAVQLPERGRCVYLLPC